jgi:hypothetical protein
MCRIPYSSAVQQPIRVPATLGKHRHTTRLDHLIASRAAPVVCNQVVRHGLMQEQPWVDAGTTETDARLAAAPSIASVRCHGGADGSADLL